jgi:hypothetical protein
MVQTWPQLIGFKTPGAKIAIPRARSRMRGRSDYTSWLPVVTQSGEVGVACVLETTSLMRHARSAQNLDRSRLGDNRITLA